jgi:hypothetical protein
VFGNTTLGRAGDSVDTEVFGYEIWNRLDVEVRRITVGDLLMLQGQMKGRQEINQIVGFQLNWAQYFRLREAVMRIKNEYGVGNAAAINNWNLEQFVMGLRKGCHRYRNVVTGKISKRYEEQDPRLILAGRNLRDGIEWESRELCELNYKVWTVSHLEADFKDFCFKLVQGRLYLNNQRAHFAEVDRWCTLCLIRKRCELKARNIQPENPIYRQELEGLADETMIHLFWECPNVRDVIKQLCNDVANTRNLVINKTRYLCGYCAQTKDDSLLTIIFVNRIKYMIYNCKKRVRLPTFFHMRTELYVFLDGLTKYGRWTHGILQIANIAGGILGV